MGWGTFKAQLRDCDEIGEQELKRKYDRSNAETALDVREILSNNQKHRVLEGGVLIALEGVVFCIGKHPLRTLPA